MNVINYWGFSIHLLRLPLFIIIPNFIVITHCENSVFWASNKYKLHLIQRILYLKKTLPMYLKDISHTTEGIHGAFAHRSIFYNDSSCCANISCFQSRT